MGSVIVEIIPMMIGTAIVPVWITLVLLLLRCRGGLAKAVAFVSGLILVRLVQGIVFRYVSSSSTEAQTEERAPIIVSTLFLVAGIFLWITAINITALKKWGKEEDPDAPPPKWMAMFNSISALKAFGFGILLMAVAGKQWIFTFGALGVIREAKLPNPASAVAFLVFVLGAQSLVLAPIVVYALAPKRSPHLLEVSLQWLERNNRIIVAAVSVLFGTYFISKGFAGFHR